MRIARRDHALDRSVLTTSAVQLDPQDTARTTGEQVLVRTLLAFQRLATVPRPWHQGAYSTQHLELPAKLFRIWKQRVVNHDLVTIVVLSARVRVKWRMSLLASVHTWSNLV